MVNYVFSDKTGTLTKNIMEFKKFTVGMECYGLNEQDEFEGKYEKGVTNVSFTDPDFQKQWDDPSSENYSNIDNFVNILAICQTIVVDNKDGVINYNASSPDELALTNAARHFGVVFEARDHSGNIVIYNKKTDTRTKYELLNILEFSSARKRMSVIVRTPDDRIMIMTKGADSIIVKRLYPGQDEIVYSTMKNIDVFANEGLRTLLVAEKEIDPQTYFEWNQKYVEACQALDDRETKIEEISELIERDFRLVGSTAIEDKLQDEVGPVIKDIKTSGVKFWVLTGDKIETAINIGFSCQLLD